MKEIDTIREALEMAVKLAARPLARDKYNEALAALSAIGPDAKPQEPSEDAATLVMGWWIEWMDPTGPDSLHEVCARKLVAIITAHDDAIRRECADRADHEVAGWLAGCQRRLLRAATLGTEPARERDIAGEVWDMLADKLPARGRTELYDEMRKSFPAISGALPSQRGRNHERP